VKSFTSGAPTVGERWIVYDAAGRRTDERMSQIDVATRSSLSTRSQGARARIEAFVRDFEWTWTNAITFSMALTFFILITTSVIPSFWMYYAENTLGWGGPTDLEAALSGTLIIFDPELGFPHLSQDILLEIRDAIAMGLATGPMITLWIVGAAMQNWRKKLRGSAGDARPTGGYR
jgi:hypothetical protein